MTEAMTILIVDDEEKIREACRRVLSSQGFGVLDAENGRIALDLMAREKVDILLLDLKMPVMDGESVLEVAHAQYPDLPVIIITGHGTIDTAVECMKKGADDFITKPFHIRQFMVTVNRAADKKRLEEKARQFELENIRNLYDLNLEKSRLRTIIHCLANGVMVTNRNLEVVLHNPALCRILKLPMDLRTPTPLETIVGDPALIDTLRKIQQGSCPAEGTVSQEFTAGDRALRSISAPALDQDQVVTGTVTAFEDITVFKQLDQMKSDFLNMVAHELRSPLSSIRQLVQVLSEGLAGPLEDKQADYLSRVQKQIDNLLDLIRDLLEISKAEGGVLLRERVPTNLEDILKSIASTMEVRAREQGIEFHYECKDLRPVLVDPNGMEEVLNNLIGNAINYSPHGGRVSVTLTGFPDAVEIVVSDTGIGIPSEELDKIFDKFYRVKDPRTRHVTGSGLGLSLVKSVLDAHHGRIEVTSVPHQGTTFRVRLPIGA